MLHLFGFTPRLLQIFQPIINKRRDHDGNKKQNKIRFHVKIIVNLNERDEVKNFIHNWEKKSNKVEK
jgi:hypothetical protein